MNLANDIKGVPNASTVTGLKSNSTDDTSLPVDLVVLKFVICQSIVLVIVEFGSLFRSKLRRWSTIGIAQMGPDSIAFCAS